MCGELEHTITAQTSTTWESLKLFYSCERQREIERSVCEYIMYMGVGVRAVFFLNIMTTF